MADPLFSVRNAFYIGAYNTAANEALNLNSLSDKDAVERDCFIYRSYIAMGSYEVRLVVWCVEQYTRLRATLHASTNSFNVHTCSWF